MSEYYKERLQLRIDEVRERLDKLLLEKESLKSSHDPEHRLFEDRMERNHTDTAIFRKVLTDLRKEMTKNE